jgi:hypothetical protein
MVSFGAVMVEPGLERTFYSELRTISEKFESEALEVSGFTREQTLALPVRVVYDEVVDCTQNVTFQSSTRGASTVTAMLQVTDNEDPILSRRGITPMHPARSISGNSDDS